MSTPSAAVATPIDVSLAQQQAVRTMSKSEYTSITATAETADKLYEHKQRGETWDEFLRRKVLNE
jgi:hypothetical protein